MNKEIIKRIIADFHESKLPDIKSRILKIPADTGEIIILSGVRRSGKTYHLLNIIKNLVGSGTDINNIIYFNFEDERLDLTDFKPDEIIQSYLELYPGKTLNDCYFLFDEIQNINNWQVFIRRIYDSVSKNIYLTGSNSKLLSKEISTSLRGRSITFEIYPLSFKEYLNFLEVELNLYSTKSSSQIINLFQLFLFNGGFPEIIKMNNDLKNKVLQEYFNVMIFRDLIERFDIKQTAILRYFCKRVIGNSAKEFSVNKIFNELKSQGYKISKDKLYEFQNDIESIYLALFLLKYSKSVVKSELAQKKAYSIDNGISTSLDFNLSKDVGSLLENLIFLELVKSGKKVSYYKNKFECDFLIIENDEVIRAIQVCADLNNEKTFDRELKGLKETCANFGLNSGKIITLYEEKELKMENIKIQVIPAYKYILQEL
jgi:predicted AAA+ superfamily ATPase